MTGDLRPGAYVLVHRLTRNRFAWVRLTGQALANHWSTGAAPRRSRRAPSP